MARKSRKNLQKEQSAQVSVYIRTAMYVRLSVEDNCHRGNSLENQQLVINDYLSNKPEFQLYDTYIDNGLSGRNFNRPSFQRMLADIEAGKIDCVVVKDLSRLGRNFIDTSYYIEQYFFTHNIRFIAVTDQFDTADPNNLHGGIMLPLKNMINEAYSLDIGKKIKAQQRQAMRDGEYVGARAPYGYKKDPHNCHKLIIDEEPAQVVRQIFQWAYDGVGISEIVRKLNEMGAVTPSHYKKATGEIKHENLIGRGKWQSFTVAKILKSEVYIGDMVQGKTKTIDHSQIRADEDNYITVRNTHEPLVSREVFEKVNQRLQQIHESSTAKVLHPYTPNLFKGKIYCAHCRRHLNRLCARHKTVPDTYRFYCISNNRIAHGTCPGVSIREDELIPSVIEILETKLSVALGDCLPDYYLEFAQQKERLSIITDSGVTKAELLRNQRLIQGLYENVVQGVITTEDYYSLKKGYEQRIEELSAELTAYSDRITELDNEVEEYKSVREDALLLNSNHQLTTELIERLIDRVVISHDKEIKIVYRFQDDYTKAVKS